MKSEILRMGHVCRQISNKKVLDDFNLNVFAGEIVSLLGLSGSGKTTLARIITGNEGIDSGRIYFNETPVAKTSRQTAKINGMMGVFREMRLVGQLSVAENLFVIKENKSRKFLLRKKIIHGETAELMAAFGPDIGSTWLGAELSVAMQHMVHLIKLTVMGARLIVVDDLTQGYTQKEKDALCRVIRQCRSRGVVFLMNHRHIDEAMAVSDRMVVLRDGRNVKTIWREDYVKDTIQSYLLNNTAAPIHDRSRSIRPEEALSVSNPM